MKTAYPTFAPVYGKGGLQTYVSNQAINDDAGYGGDPYQPDG